MLNVSDMLRRAYLDAAYQAVIKDEKQVQLVRAFYGGTQGISLTARQKEYLGDIANDLDDQALCNICQRAVEIPLERLAVEGINAVGTGNFAELAQAWWDVNQLSAWQYYIYEAALRDATTCIIVGWNGTAPTYTLNEIYDGVNGAVRLHYSEDDGTLLFASKRYGAYDSEKLILTGKTRLTMYFPDRIERYEDSAGELNGWRTLTEREVGGLNPQPWVDGRGDPLGLPVIVFDNPGGSELANVLMPQKAMNKSLADMLSAQDLHGFPLMVLQGYKQITGADGKAAPIKMTPGEAITTPAEGSVARVPGADLAPMFNTGVMGWLQLASIIKGWPMYLWARGDPPSGEALKVMESSLVSQVRRKQEGFEDSWREALMLGARLQMLFTGTQVTGDIEIKWKDPETRNSMLAMQELKMKFEIGQIPTTQRWKELGYDETTIQDMQSQLMGEAMNAARQSVLSALMAQRTAPALMEPDQQLLATGTEAL